MERLLIVPRVPRTGSTSMQRVLKTHFRGKWAGAVGTTLEEAWECFKRAPNHDKAVAVSGHFPHLELDNARFASVLREPLGRVLSLWRFTYRRHCLDFGSWIEVAGDYAHNQLVRYFSGGPICLPWGDLLMFRGLRNPPLRELRPHDLVQAKKNLSRYALLGVAKRFTEFQRELEGLIGAKRQPDWHVTGRENARKGTPDPHVPSAGERARVDELNHLDWALYQWAEERAA